MNILHRNHSRHWYAGFCRAFLFCCGLLAGLGAGTNSVTGAVLYVSPQGHHTPPFTNWWDAATNILDAVKASHNFDTVLVTNGLYRLNATIRLTNAVCLQSVGNASNTVIDGQGSVRCVFLDSTNATIDGFTIANGYAVNTNGGGVFIERGGSVLNCTIISNRCTYRGGGVWCTANGIISNCTVAYNRTLSTSDANGGGIALWFSGLVQHCDIFMNVAGEDGGGIQCDYGGTVRDSTIRNNFVGGGGNSSGGGVRLRRGGLVENCRIVQNRADWGGGVWIREGGTVRNCSIVSNAATTQASGVMISEVGRVEQSLIAHNSSPGGAVEFGFFPGKYGIVENCLIVSNFGWGVSFNSSIVQTALVVNCTVVGNSAGGCKSASTNGQVLNSIVYYNGGTQSSVPSGTINYSCISPPPGGIGNTTNAPQIVSLSAGDYRVASNSPCIDAGAALPAVVADYAGTPRPLDGDTDGSPQWDIGAYEYASPLVDADSDGASDAAELLAGTGPLSPTSVLAMRSLVSDTGRLAMGWSSVPGKAYWLQCSTNLIAGSWTNMHSTPVRATNDTDTMFLDEAATNSVPGAFYRVLLDQ